MTADIDFTTHAVQRFIERVQPGSDPTRAVSQLHGMRPAMTLTATPPQWLADRLRHDADR